MKIRIVYFIFFLITLQGFIYSQEKNEKKRPDEKIQVTKEFDKDGNLIQYDSIYSYSTFNSQMSKKDMDSIFKKKFPLSKSLLFDTTPADFDELRFFDDLINLDSIWRQHHRRQKLLFDRFFKSKVSKEDSIGLKKLNR